MSEDVQREIKYLKSIIYGLSKDINQLRVDLNTHTNTVGLHQEDQEYPDLYQENMKVKLKKQNRKNTED